MVHELNTSHWHRLTPDSSGNYVNGSWSTLASLPDNNGIPASKGGPTNAPLYFASAVLGDGTVFVAGGENNTGKQDADILTAQIYDPLSDTWTPIATPPGWTGIGDAPTCALPDGRLLIGSFESNANALFDPKTQIWQAGGTKADSCSEETFTLMPNGNVLTVECSNAPNAEQYIPSSNTWVSASSTPATLPQACPGFVPEIGPAILLPDGRVFAIGATGATALYTPDPDPTIAGTWVGGPSLVDAHGNPSFPMDTPATLLPNGKVLLASAPGPPCNYPSPTTFFLYDPSTNTASVETSPSNGDGSPYGGRMLLLPTGQVMYSANRKDMEVYTPDAGGDPSWKPAIINFPDTLIVGGTHTISGTQFNGLSQACSYGDDAQMATNYPIVQLKSGNKVYFLRTSNHSTMGVATGNATVSTNIFVPSNVQTGPASMIVIANGIASDPVSVTVGTRDSFFLLDRSTFSQGEILALINLNGAPATISDAVFVVVEGFSKDQISGNAPSIPNPLAQISLQPAGPAIPQDPTLPSSAVQRFSFPFNMVFQDTSVFGTTSQTLTLNSQFSADNSDLTASAQI
ncbi:MAG: kelch repeat-containing protein, partial [Xanthobacteraceae bacterium]